VPALGCLIMFSLFFGACLAFGSPDPNRTVFYGIGAPLVFAAGAFALGFILLLVARIYLPDFFNRTVEMVNMSNRTQTRPPVASGNDPS
jgi:hypothetical protein